MSVYALKPRFQALLRPIAGALARAGVTANQVTVLAALGSVVLGVFLIVSGDESLFIFLPAWLFVRMALNAIDGMLAREHGQASRLGGYLNELGDVVSDAVLYLPFACLPGSSGDLVGGVIMLAVVSEMAGVLGVAAGASRRYDGPFGKSDRAFVFGLLGLLEGLAVWPIGFYDWVWVAMLVLLALTIANRVRRGVVEAKQQEAKQHEAKGHEAKRP